MRIQHRVMSMNKITDHFRKSSHSASGPSNASPNRRHSQASGQSQSQDRPHKAKSQEVIDLDADDHQPSTSKQPKSKAEDQRSRLRKIGAETIDALEAGFYAFDVSTSGKAESIPIPLTNAIEESCNHTEFFSPNCELRHWRTSIPISSSQPPHDPPNTSTTESTTRTQISVLEITTLQAAALLNSSPTSSPSKIGILNFASAKKEGGGFINGAQAQEESIARASTLYPTLLTDNAQKFYKLHRSDPHGGYYTHAMIYSPDVWVIRYDDSTTAEWHTPVVVDVLTSPAVNQGVVLRDHLHVDKDKDTQRRDEKADEEIIRVAKGKVKEVMHERMARILYLYELKGVKSLVLGSFGTGVFRNDVDTVAGLWKELIGPNGRFARSFSRIVFAVIGRETYDAFKSVLGPLERS